MTARPFSTLLFGLLLPGAVMAHQMSHPVVVSRDDVFRSPRSLLSGTDTLDVLCVMVQFQSDSDERTTGNGRFDLTSSAGPIIDAPPHDRQYFLDHLDFLVHYYWKTSKGKVLVRPTLLDSVFTLHAPMSAYSPPKGGGNAAVGNLARDSWTMVDSSRIVPDFSLYRCFIIFHAGAGRDIDLVGTLGYDPTPLDIPSLYLGMNAFREFYGQSYQGIPVSGGKVHITNSIIIPETESRSIPTATGTSSLLELSINGLLCASFGNFLGLPDLFDTKTGRTGIGKFGLMDGQAIFGFSGLFPPEPSAWEKFWLGWLSPISLPPGTQTISLPAVSVADTVYRISISAQEYFLVENRNRDPRRNGQTIMFRYNGVQGTRTFSRDTTGFNAYDISALQGTVIDVEDYDWSLPGGTTSDGTFFDGGVLVWHVDENVIAGNLQTNTVNADPGHRGVDVEEADGSQDIGQQYEGVFSAGQGSEEGTALDFWFSGNSSPVYRNEFSSTTHPNSNSYGGADSHIRIFDFSGRGPRMTARVSLGDDLIAPLAGYPRSSGEQLAPHALAVGPLSTNSLPALTVATTGVGVSHVNLRGAVPAPARGKVFSWRSDGAPALPGGFATGLVGLADSPNPPQVLPIGFRGGTALSDLNGDGITELLAGQDPATGSQSEIKAFSFKDIAPHDSLADLLFSLRLGRALTTAPLIGDSLIAVGAEGGVAYFLDLSGVLVDSIQLPGSRVEGISRLPSPERFVATSGSSVSILSRKSGSGRVTADASRNIEHRVVGPTANGRFGSNGGWGIAFGTVDGLVYLLDDGLRIFAGFPVTTYAARTLGPDSDSTGVISEPPALADLDGDGLRDIVVFSDDKICAFNISGASLDNFPVRMPAGSFLRSAPIIADLDGNGDPEVVGVTQDGLVVAYSRTGRLTGGFPLQASSGRNQVAAFEIPSIPPGASHIALAVASDSAGVVSAWTTGALAGPVRTSTFAWPQYQKDSRRSGFTDDPLTGSNPISTFLPAERAYNWPNPVYDGKTYVRYFVKENASVRIRILDLAGDLVAEFDGPGIGGVDNEVAWDVSNVQSGIYFARIHALAAGKSGLAVVKVAVVK